MKGKAKQCDIVINDSQVQCKQFNSLSHAGIRFAVLQSNDFLLVNEIRFDFCVHRFDSCNTGAQVEISCRYVH